MRNAILLLSLLVSALPAAAAPPPEKPGAALAGRQFPPCDYKPDYWTPEGSLSKPLVAGDWNALQGELEELHASFERNHACERRMAWAFEHGFFFTQDLPAQLDRWVAARPKAWTAYTIRGAMWMELAWQAHEGWHGSHPTDGAEDAMNAATERAVADLERAIRLQPRAVVAHGALIELSQMHHDPRGVEARYRRAIEIDPVSMHVLAASLTALEPRFGGSRERAALVIEAARLREKENPRIARLYGYPHALRADEIEAGLSQATRDRRAPLDKREGEQMIAWYTRALRYSEPGSDWHYKRASVYRDLNQHRDVIAEADFALAAQPSAERWWSLKAYSLAELKRFDEALATARAGLKHVPGSRDLRWYEADAIYRMGRYDEAAALHRAALADAKTPAERRTALGGLGAALQKAKRYAEAEPVILEATRLDPWHALTWYSLGEVRWELGRYQDAAVAFEHFLAKSQGKTWFDAERMRAQEKLDLVLSRAVPAVAGPPARAGER